MSEQPIHLQSIGASVLRQIYEGRSWFTPTKVLDYASTFNVTLTDEAQRGLRALHGVRWEVMEPEARQWLDRTLEAILTPSPIAERPKPAKEPKTSERMLKLWGWLQ